MFDRDLQSNLFSNISRSLYIILYYYMDLKHTLTR